MTKHKKSGQIIRHKVCDVIVLKHNILSAKIFKQKQKSYFLAMYLRLKYNF